MKWRKCEYCGEEYAELSFFTEAVDAFEFVAMGKENGDEVISVGKVTKFITYCPKYHIIREEKKRED
jgi:hypothetical protein